MVWATVRRLVPWRARGQPGYVDNTQPVYIVRQPTPLTRPLRKFAFTTLTWAVILYSWNGFPKRETPNEDHSGGRRVASTPVNETADPKNPTQAQKALIPPGSALFEAPRSIFLGLPWTQQHPGRPYKPDDPEPIRYRQFMKNKEERAKVAEEVTKALVFHLLMIREMRERVGKLLKIERHYSFQLSSPPYEYTRSGLEISRDGVRWSTRPTQARHVFMLQRVLWPRDFVERTLGTFSSDFMSGPQQINTFLHKVRERNRLSQQNGSQGRAEGSGAPASTTSGANSTETPSAAPQTLSDLKQVLWGSSKQVKATEGKPTVRLGPPSTTPVPWSPDFARRSKPAEANVSVPRGCIHIGGPLIIAGSKARIHCTVWAAYDPTSSTAPVIQATIDSVYPYDVRLL